MPLALRPGAARLNSVEYRQVFGGRFPVPPRDEFVLNLLPLAQCAQSGTLDRGNVDKSVLRSILRFDKAISLHGVEPFDRSSSHDYSFRKNKTSGADAPCYRPQASLS